MDPVLIKLNDKDVFEIAQASTFLERDFQYSRKPFHARFPNIKNAQQFAQCFTPFRSDSWEQILNRLGLGRKNTSQQPATELVFELIGSGVLALEKLDPQTLHTLTDPHARKGRNNRGKKGSKSSSDAPEAVVVNSSSTAASTFSPSPSTNTPAPINHAEPAKVNDDDTTGTPPLEDTPTNGCPISMISGEELLRLDEFSLPGPIPFKWRRTYRSGHSRDIGLGHGWTHSACEQLREDSGQFIVLDDDEGRILRFKRPRLSQSSRLINEGLTLTNQSPDSYLLTKDGTPNKLFRRVGRSGVFRLSEIHHSAYTPSSPQEKLASGFVLTLNHDAKNRLTSIESNWGKRLNLKRTPQGRISKIWLEDTISGEKRLASAYEYDAQGDLTAHRDGAGLGESYQYHNHLFTQRTLSTGFNYYYEWDGNSNKARCTRTWGDHGIYDYHFTWDPEHNRSTAIDGRGNQLHYEYNEFGQLIREADGEGGIHQYQYENSKKAAYIDPLGNKTRYTYDADQHVTGVFGPDGKNKRPLFSQTRWYFRGKLSQINHNGALWRREYNRNGLLEKVIAPDSRATHYEYSPQGLLTRVTSPENHQTQYTWSPYGELTGVTHADGQSQRFRYNPFGQILAIEYWLPEEKKAGELKYQYNDRDQVVRIIYPDKRFTALEYNANGHIESIRDRNGRITRYEYDGLSQVVRKVDALGNSIRYEYDKERNLTALINENGDRYTFEYDGNERLISEIGFDGRKQRYFYNPAGHLIRSVDSDEVLTDYERDPLGRMLTRKSYKPNELASEAFAAHLHESWRPLNIPLNTDRPTTVDPEEDYGRFSYDPAGRLAECFNPHQLLQFSYDAMGRVTGEQHTNIFEFKQVTSSIKQFRFDHTSSGFLKSLELPDNQHIHYQYDGFGRLLNAALDNQELTDIQRDDLGNEIQRRQGALATQFDYDPMGRLVNQFASDSQNEHRPISRRYQYDDFGNLSQLIDGEKEINYAYDKINRLSKVESDTPENFVFDPASNLLSQGDGPGKAKGNRLLIQGDRKFAYDKRGNLVRERRGKQGSIVSEYTYNANNQLIKSTRGKQITEYRYDPLGRRIEKKDTFGCTQFYWAGDQLLQEQRGDSKKTYVYEPNSYKPLALVENDTIYHYHLDHLGTPRELSDQKGKIVWQARYKTYGNVAIKEVDEVDNPLRFQGQYYDDETGLHYNRHRYYNPHSGQFITQDPIGLLGGVNNYQYAPNPTGWIDPLGLCNEEYQQRTEQLIASDGEMTTLDAYTHTDVSGAPWDIAADPNNWIEERQAFQEKVIGDATAEAILKAKGQTDVATIHAMRGNTGAGKSRLKRSGLIPELANDNIPVINPDDFKPTIISEAEPGKITHNQAHWEASMMSDRLKDNLLNNEEVSSILVDKRLGSPDEVIRLREEASKHNKKLNVYDVDAPLEMSLLGVLLREPGGNDPIVPFDVVTGGYSSARNNRQEIIQYFEDNPDIGKYELYGSTPDGNKYLVSVTENGKTNVIDKEAYIRLTSNSDLEIAEISDEPISSETIQKITANLPDSDFKEKSIQTLNANRGKTWKQALDDHGKSGP